MASEYRAERICAIVNPRAGSWKRPRYARHDPADLVAHWLAPTPPGALSIRVMRKARDGVVLTRDALAEGCATIVAVGGDGTINDVLQALGDEHEPTRARLGLIPM